MKINLNKTLSTLFIAALLVGILSINSIKANQFTSTDNTVETTSMERIDLADEHCCETINKLSDIHDYIDNPKLY